MDFFFNHALSLITLTILEIILGIDNLVFLAIISERLPAEQRKRARQFGLTLAWVTRLLLLAGVVWLAHLTAPLMTLANIAFSGRDLLMLFGGLFLIYKGTREIHLLIEPEQEQHAVPRFNRLSWVVIQIAILDIIFSLDSVLTAVGLTQEFWLMATAITIAILAMIFASEPLSRFITKHPTVKMLALAFLLLIGAVLIADGLHFHVPRGYIYFAMGFSLSVEALNLVRQKRAR